MESETTATVLIAIRTVLDRNLNIGQNIATLVVSKFVKGDTTIFHLHWKRAVAMNWRFFVLLSQGKGTREIAQEMNVAMPTIISFETGLAEIKFPKIYGADPLFIKCFRKELAIAKSGFDSMPEPCKSN